MDKKLKAIRKRCLDIAHTGGDANLQSCFSSVEILWALYHGGMRWSPERAGDMDRDRFLMSKGQSSLALTATLEDMGVLRPEEVDTYCRFGSRFSMQIDRTKFAPCEGIENSAGSLGHGFPMAVGLAWALKIKKSDSHIWVLAGDGEMNEGTMWEASAFAGGHKLSNITLVIDDNDSVGRMLDLSSLRQKLESFGFFVIETDGHDVDSLAEAYAQCVRTERKPQAVIAHTVRGYGSRTLMENNEWFHKAPDAEQLEKLRQEVDDF